MKRSILVAMLLGVSASLFAAVEWEDLIEAKALAAEGKYEEALKQHVKFHDESKRTSMDWSKLSYAIECWLALAEKYPPAAGALIEIREKDEKAFLDGKGTFDNFQDLATLNDALGDEDRTYELFMSVYEKHPNVAKKCHFAVDDLLLKKQEYVICAEYMGDPIFKYEKVRNSREMNLSYMRQRPNPTDKDDLSDEEDLSYANKKFVTEICQMIEVLVGVNREADAAEIQKRALKYFEHDLIKTAITDAKTKIGPKRLAEIAAMKPAMAPKAPDDRAEISAALKEVKEAVKLAEEGNHDDAFQKLMAIYEEPETSRISRAGRIGAFSGLVKLSKDFQPAKDALLVIRNMNEAALLDGTGGYDQFQTLSSINEAFGQEDESYELFMTLHGNQPDVAADCYYAIDDLLVEKQEYEIYGKYMGNPIDTSENLRSWRELLLARRRSGVNREKGEEQTDPDSDFIKKTRQLVEVLVGLDRQSEAEEIQKRALAYFEHDLIKTALADAQKRVMTSKKN